MYGAITLFGGPFDDTYAPPPVRFTICRLQFADRRPEITSLGFSRFRRPY